MMRLGDLVVVVVAKDWQKYDESNLAERIRELDRGKNRRKRDEQVNSYPNPGPSKMGL